MRNLFCIDPSPGLGTGYSKPSFSVIYLLSLPSQSSLFFSYRWWYFLHDSVVFLSVYLVEHSIDFILVHTMSFNHYIWDPGIGMFKKFGWVDSILVHVSWRMSILCITLGKPSFGHFDHDISSICSKVNKGLSRARGTSG